MKTKIIALIIVALFFSGCTIKINCKEIGTINVIEEDQAEETSF